MNVYSISCEEYCSCEGMSLSNTYYTQLTVQKDDYYIKMLNSLYRSFDTNDGTCWYVTTYKNLGVYNPLTDDKFIKECGIDSRYIEMLKSPEKLILDISLKDILDDNKDFSELNYKYNDKIGFYLLSYIKNFYKNGKKIYRKEDYIIAIYDGKLIFIDSKRFKSYNIEFKE